MDNYPRWYRLILLMLFMLHCFSEIPSMLIIYKANKSTYLFLLFLNSYQEGIILLF